MKILYKWENDCFLFNPYTDAYYLEVNMDELNNEILNIMEEKDKMNMNDYIKRINERSKDTLICVNKNCLYILVDKNLSKAILCEPVYPYSNQWGAYCPFKRLYKKENDHPDILEGNKEYMERAIEINELNDVKNINKILVEKGYCA